MIIQIHKSKIKKYVVKEDLGFGKEYMMEWLDIPEFLSIKLSDYELKPILDWLNIDEDTLYQPEETTTIV
jgi:hypothetical protein